MRRKNRPELFFILLVIILIIAMFSFFACDNKDEDDGGDDRASLDDDDDSVMDDDDDTTTDDDSTDDDDDDDDDDGGTWTILVYIAADNDLEMYALDDLMEMQAVGSTSRINITAVFDGKAQDDSKYYFVDKNDLKVIKTPPELNMGDPQSLKDAAEWAFSTYPADKYALILWNHGSGWHKGKQTKTYKDICQDSSSGDDWLTNVEFDQALSWIRSNTGADPLDLLGFDACLMMMAEIAYYLIDDANVLVGSEEVEDATGYDYKGFLTQLIQDPGMSAGTLGKYIAQTFVNIPDATMSALSLPKMSGIADAVEGLADELAILGGLSHGGIQSAMDQVLYFDDYDYIDLYHFAELLQTTVGTAAINSEAQAVMDAIDDAIIWNGYGYPEFSNAHGLSIYYPDPMYSTFDSAYLSLDFSVDTGWGNLIQF